MYGTTAALPFGTIVIIIVIWALVTFPLTVVGGIMGKNTKVRTGAGGGVQKWGLSRVGQSGGMDVPTLCGGSMLSQPLSEQPMPTHAASSHPCLPSQAEFNAPCRTTKYPREIPPLPWYRQTLPQMLMAGFLPFSAIYIELCELEGRLGWEEGQMAGWVERVGE